MYIVEPTKIQPSSTSIRMTIYPLTKNAKDLLEMWKDEDIIEKEGKKYYMHYADEVPLKAYYHFYEIMFSREMRKHVAENDFMVVPSDGSTLASNPLFDKFDKLMIIIDMNQYCHVRCPWCYASLHKKEDIALIDSFLETENFIYSSTEKIIKQHLNSNNVSVIEYTYAIGGSGDPLVSPSDLQYMIDLLAELNIPQYDDVFIHRYIAFSTSDIFRLLTNIDVIPLHRVDEVSISYHDPVERQYLPIYKNIDSKTYVKLLTKTILEILEKIPTKQISIQYIVKEELTEETVKELYDIANIIYASLPINEARGVAVPLFLLRYYEIPWFNQFHSSNPGTILANTLKIIRSWIDGMNIISYVEMPPVYFDTCLASLITNLPLYKYEKNIVYRINPFKREYSKIDICPRGNICQIAKHLTKKKYVKG